MIVNSNRDPVAAAAITPLATRASVRQLRAQAACALYVEHSRDSLCKARIHALRSYIHGLSESMLCAQHIHYII